MNGFPARGFGLAAMTLAMGALAPQAARAQAFAAPAGYAVQNIFATNAGIGGFDVADDGSIVMILGSGGYGSAASSLVRWDPIGHAFNTLYIFPDTAFGSFVETAGSRVYFGQSGAYPDATSETNRVMSIGLDGSGLTTNLLLQNYASALDAAGRIFFTGNPNSNAVFLVSGTGTNRVIEMPTYSGGLAFATNGDLYVAQTTASFQNNLFRFTRAQVSNAIALGVALQPSAGVHVGTNLAGSSYLAADSDADIFFPDFSGSLYAFDTTSGHPSLFGSITGGFAVVSSMQFRPGSGPFEPSSYDAGTLYALLTDFGAFNAIIAVGVPNSRASWNATLFTPAEQLDDSVSGFFANPDGDAQPNGLEYAFSGNPRRPDAHDAIEPTVSGGRLSIRFTRDPMNRDLDYVVEVSGTLQPGDWQEIARSAAGTPTTGTGQITESLAGQKVRVTVADPGGGTARFIRVRAELIQP